jgi:hypothetical protein
MLFTLKEHVHEIGSEAPISSMLLTSQYETTFTKGVEMGTKKMEPDFLEKALSGHESELEWLTEHLKTKVSVVLYGEKSAVNGMLVQFDAETLVIESTGNPAQTCLVFKSAVQYIREAAPQGGFNL